MENKTREPSCPACGKDLVLDHDTLVRGGEGDETNSYIKADCEGCKIRYSLQLGYEIVSEEEIE